MATSLETRQELFEIINCSGTQRRNCEAQIITAINLFRIPIYDKDLKGSKHQYKI